MSNQCYLEYETQYKIKFNSFAIQSSSRVFILI